MSIAPGQNKRKRIVRKILSLKHHRNRSSIKCALVAEGLPYSSKEVAQVLGDLESDGMLNAWGSSTPTTYLIEFEAADVGVEVPDESHPDY